jgi:general secretion pathway protein J
VRSAIGPNERPHLEVIRFAEASDDRGRALTRTEARFAPVARGRPAQPFAYADPVALIRAPLQVSFAYAGPDRVWAQRWKDQERLPEAIRITVRDPASRTVVASTAERVRVTAAVSTGKGQPTNGSAEPTPPTSSPSPTTPQSNPTTQQSNQATPQ